MRMFGATVVFVSFFFKSWAKQGSIFFPWHKFKRNISGKF